MKQRFLLLFVTALLAGCNPTGQVLAPDSSSNYASRYADQLDPGAVFLKTWYHYTVEKTKEGSYVHKIYYPDTRQITSYTTYKDKNLTLAHGLHKSWNDDGTLSNEGYYVDGKREGEWKQGRSTGLYKNDLSEGLWITKDSSGNIISEFNYLVGKLQGPFKIFTKSGKLKREGSFKEGALEWEKVYTDDATILNEEEEGFKLVEEMPYFSANCPTDDKATLKKCSEEAMLRFLYSHIKYPMKARQLGIQGMAITSFVVEKDGTISNVRAVKGLCDEIKNECERVVGLMPPWIPGKQNGKPVRVQFSLPLKFKLE